MKVAILGYGKMGKIRHEVLNRLYPDLDISCYDPFGKYKDNDPKKLIEESDVVFICTPNYMNSKYTILSIRAGKHVFCEKPPAKSYSEFMEVYRLYKGKNTSLVYGFNHRRYDSIDKMKSIIDSQKYGKILWMRGRYGKVLDKERLSEWRMDEQKSGGGILLDQGIHMVDLMIYFSGHFDQVQAIMSNNLWKKEGIEDNVFLNLRNSKSGISASVHSTMIEWRHIFSLEVLMETGYLALNGLNTPSGAYGQEVLTICGDKHKQIKTDTSIMIEFKNNNSWDKEIKMFMDSIEKGRTTNIEDAKTVMAILGEAYSNGKVHISEQT